MHIIMQPSSSQSLARVALLTMPVVSTQCLPAQANSPSHLPQHNYHTHIYLLLPYSCIAVLLTFPLSTLLLFCPYLCTFIAFPAQQLHSLPQICPALLPSAHPRLRIGCYCLYPPHTLSHTSAGFILLCLLFCPLARSAVHSHSLLHLAN